MNRLPGPPDPSADALLHAEGCILAAAGAGEWWPSELLDQVMQSHPPQPPGLMPVALWSLVNDGRLALGADLRVRRLTG
jgi:hypothetical protein